MLTISQPIEKEITDYDVYTGRIEAAETVEVRARVRGELTAIHFKDGALVKAKDPLFDIDIRPYKAAMDVALATKATAEANLKLAESEYSRTQSLYATNATSVREVEVWLAKKGIAIAEVGKAQAEVERAKRSILWTIT